MNWIDWTLNKSIITLTWPFVTLLTIDRVPPYLRILGRGVLKRKGGDENTHQNTRFFFFYFLNSLPKQDWSGENYFPSVKFGAGDPSLCLCIAYDCLGVWVKTHVFEPRNPGIRQSPFLVSFFLFALKNSKYLFLFLTYFSSIFSVVKKYWSFFFFFFFWGIKWVVFQAEECV